MCIEFKPLTIMTGKFLVTDSVHAGLGKRKARVVDQVRIGGDATGEVIGALHCFADDDARVIAVFCNYFIARGRSRVTSIGGVVRGFDQAKLVLKKGALAYAYGGEIDAWDNSVVIIPADCNAQPVVRLHGKRALLIDQRVSRSRVRHLSAVA